MGSFHLISSITRQVSKMKTILLLTIAFSNILLGEGFDPCSSDSDCPVVAGKDIFCQTECGLCSLRYEGNSFNPCEPLEFCSSDADCRADVGFDYVCKQDCGYCSPEDIKPWEFEWCDNTDDCPVKIQNVLCHPDCSLCSPEDFDPCNGQPYASLETCSQDQDCATIAGLNITCHPGICIPDILNCPAPPTPAPTPAPTPMPITTPSTTSSTTTKKKPKKCRNKRQKCQSFRRKDPRCKKKSTKRKCAKCNCRSKFCKKCQK